MNIEILKQGLQQILNEDLSNRSSISELRRNVFLQTSKTEEKESVLVTKEKTIGELSSEVDYYKNQLVLREKSILENASSFQGERDSLLDVITEKENQISELRAQEEKLHIAEALLEEKNQELNRLLLENSNYSAKIRELVEHIAEVETKQEQFLKESASLKVKADWAEKFKKEFENSKNENLALNEHLILEKNANESMKIQLSSLTEELNNSVILYQKTQAELLEIKEFQEARKEAEEKLRQDSEKLNGIQLELDTINKELTDKVVELESNQQKLVVINSDLQESNFELLNELNALKLSSSETIEILREELVQMENLSVETITTFQTEVQALKQQLTSRQNGSDKSLELESINKELNNKIQLLNQQISDLGVQLSSREAGDQIIEKELSELKSVNESLRESNQETLKLLTNANHACNELTALKDSLNQSVEEWGLKCHISELKYQEAVLKSNELTAINESLLSFRENYITAQQQIAELDKRLLDHQLKLSDSVAKVEHEQLMSELEALKAELSEVQQLKSTDPNELENQLKVSSERIIQLENQVLAMNGKDAENSDADSLNLKNDNKRLSMLSEMLKKRVAELETLNSDLKGSSSSTDNAEINRLQLLADDLNTEKIRLEQTVIDLRRELFKAEENMAHTLDEQNSAQVELLNSENSKLNLQKQELENQVADLLEKLQLLGKASGGKKGKVADLENSEKSINLASVLNVSLESKKTLKLKINELVKEIDRCIAMLNAQS